MAMATNADQRKRRPIFPCCALIHVFTQASGSLLREFILVRVTCALLLCFVHVYVYFSQCTITLCPSADAPQSSSVTVNPGETVPFWPESSDLKNLALRVGDNQELSPRFNFQPDVAVMLRVDDKVGGWSPGQSAHLFVNTAEIRFSALRSP